MWGVTVSCWNPLERAPSSGAFHGAAWCHLDHKKHCMTKLFCVFQKNKSGNPRVFFWTTFLAIMIQSDLCLTVLILPSLPSILMRATFLFLLSAWRPQNNRCEGVLLPALGEVLEKNIYGGMCTKNLLCYMFLKENKPLAWCFIMKNQLSV